MSTTDGHTKSDGSRKIFQQRRYRSTEAEDFAQLRQVIRDVSQENPHTRHDILTKAIEIIKQLSADYHSQKDATWALTTTGSTDPPIQYPTPVHPVSYFYPENCSIDYDHPMWIYPSYASSSSDITDSMYAPGVSLSNMDNITYDYGYFNSQSG
ncbi:hypothetical protein BDR07DRAFT_1489690 [Suillus spraguei]|nr:hypothetical protein BDR07DRAFT_1489690 [Suillus spraguei]